VARKKKKKEAIYRNKYSSYLTHLLNIKREKVENYLPGMEYGKI
jgi:hypothetical protein